MDRTRAGDSAHDRRRGEVYYRGADLRRAQRFGVGAWSFGLLILVALAVGYPPDRHGPAGWLLLAATVAILPCFAVTAALGRASFRALLQQQYVGAVVLAGLQWCAGGWPAPYHLVFGAMILYASFVHPRVTALPLVALCALLTVLPAAYGPGRELWVPVLLDLSLWLGVAAFANQLMATVRSQRLELAERNEAALRDARRDHLTGLLNRRAFGEVVTAELQNGRATGAGLSLAVGDVDRFKQVNDDFGHAVGDACLVGVGRALQRVVLAPDSVFRWGGDEFVVLLRGSAVAALACPRLEDAVTGSVATPDGRPVRVTFGVVPDDGYSEPDQLVAAADAALLTRKRRRHGEPVS